MGPCVLSRELPVLAGRQASPGSRPPGWAARPSLYATLPVKASVHYGQLDGSAPGQLGAII